MQQVAQPENSMLLRSMVWGIEILDPNLWLWSKIT